MSMYRHIAICFLCVQAISFFGMKLVQGQQDEIPASDGEEETTLQSPDEVDVVPVADDSQIAQRLANILEATQWFEDTEVRVDEGVVFLKGQTETEEHREWAEKLAASTDDVVAVVNRIRVKEKSMWDLSPAWRELEDLGTQLVRNSPLLGVALIFLVATWFVTKWSVTVAKWALRRNISSALLRDVTARAIAVPVFIFGLYLVLKVSGLSRLAMTVLGGTGLVGLVIGFAFRDIAENFLASILISMQHPFARGDFIEVAGHKGFVQSVNTRSTLLMTLDGNHIQIPNATIYKEPIVNRTANPYSRFDFTVGIGYDDPIERAQSIALDVLRGHSAVTDDPEPLVLVESLGAATVNLRAYFWVDVNKFSQFKVLSAIVRLTKRAFDQAGISMPDEAREVVFPAGVPVQMVESRELPRLHGEESEATSEEDGESISAEGDLGSEAAEINEQAQRARNPEAGQNLLEP